MEMSLSLVSDDMYGPSIMPRLYLVPGTTHALMQTTGWRLKLYTPLLYHIVTVFPQPFSYFIRLTFPFIHPCRHRAPQP